MFATFAGGYNRKPNIGLPDDLGDAERRVRDGTLDAAGFAAVADAFVREILAEQEIVGLAIVGDGGVRAPDRVRPLIDGLAGLAAGEATTLPDGETVTRPLITGPVRWIDPIHVRDWEFAADSTDQLAKQTLIGPYTLAALAAPSPGQRRANLALAFGEALNQELLALADAGCAMIEIDEPAALQLGDADAEWRAFHAANQRLTNGLVGADAPHLSLGLWGGQIDRAGHGPLLDLPYLSYLVDVLAGPSAWRFIDAVPAERGIVVGSGDASTEALDEQELHVWAMAWAAQGGRTSARVGCSPNGTLSRIGRHFAHRKCLRLGEAVKIAAMGPLQEVAESLNASPATSSFPELRALAHAVAAARGE